MVSAASSMELVRTLSLDTVTGLTVPLTLAVSTKAATPLKIGVSNSP